VRYAVRDEVAVNGCDPTQLNVSLLFF